MHKEEHKNTPGQRKMPRRISPKNDAINHAVSQTDKTSKLDVKYINPYKGRGLFSLAPFLKGDFVAEYRGEIIDFNEAERRRSIYHTASTVFMFDFLWKGRKWCVDAAKENDSFGRLVNDEHKTPNCKMKLVEAEGKPHLCLFAIRDIDQGEEITYDYGRTDWPWRQETFRVMPAEADGDTPTNGRGSGTPDGYDTITNTPDEKTLEDMSGLADTDAPTHAEGSDPPVGDEIIQKSLPIDKIIQRSFPIAKTLEDMSGLADTDAPTHAEGSDPPVGDEIIQKSLPIDKIIQRSFPIAKTLEDMPGLADRDAPTHAKGSDPPVGDEIIQKSFHIDKIYEDRLVVVDGDASTFAQGSDTPIGKEIIQKSTPIVKSSNCPLSSSDDSEREEVRIPRLRRTKSLMMNEIIPEGSDDLFDSTSDSGEEFVPCSVDGSSSSCSETSHVLPLSNLPHRVRGSSPSPPLPDSTSCLGMDFEEKTDLNSENTQISTRSLTIEEKGEGCADTVNMEVEEEATVIVNAVTKKGDGSRIYNKKHYCLFCLKPFSKMARHLEQVHSMETDVVKACLFPKGSKQRKIHLDHLRNKGNYAHNAAVLKTGKGELVPQKRPPQESQGKDYMHCAYCQGLFLRNILWRHVRNCRLHTSSATSKPGKTRVQSLCAFAGPAPSHVSKKLWQLINNMNQDDITLAVKGDKCIIQLGEHMLNKCGSSVKRHEHIRQKMRELGRFLINAKKVSTVKDVETLIDPKYYMTTVKAVKRTCGFNTEAETFRSKSLALKLGHSLGKLAKLVESNGRMAGNSNAVDKALSFQQVHATRWNELISATASRNIEEGRWNMPTILPFTEDVQLLHAYLHRKQEEYLNHLTAEPTAQNWSNLAKVSLAQVIIFNRRREGEVSSMPLTAYLSRDTSDPHGDVDWALSEMEKKLCRHFSRIETRGKRGRKVPILLTPKMLSALELLVQQRDTCGVLKDNVYMFARPAATSHYRGSDCIRNFGKACEAKNPAALSSTKLRKQIATLSTVLNMNETEMDQLANFMGHDIQIHRHFYRLPEGTLQLAKISKVLMAMEQGRLVEFKGKNLDEIEIDPHEKVQAQSEEEGCADEEENATELGLPEKPATKVIPLSESEVVPATRHVVPLAMPLRKSTSKFLKTVQKRKWETTEVQAVERHMMHFITSLCVPGKMDCEKCLRAESLALKDRDWKAVKFYIHNRMMTLKRKMYS